MKPLHNIKRFRAEGGAVLIEFAFVAIILIILIGCIVELSLLLYNKNVLDNASRVGARAAIVENAVNIDQKIVDYCSGRLINLVDGRVQDAGSAIEISPTTDADGDIRISVSYVYPFQLINMVDAMLGLIGAGPIGLNDITIIGETVMRPE